MGFEVLITSLVAPIIPTVVTYFFTRKKVMAEVQERELKNIELYRQATNSMIKDLSGQIDQLIEVNATLRSKIDKMSREIKQIKNTYPCRDCPRVKNK